MTHVVTSNCQNCRFTDCVVVCPVDCFYPTATQLVIDPEECIDCSACITECPVEAIYAEDEVPEDLMEWIEINAVTATDLREQGTEPMIEQQEPLPDAENKRSALGF